MLIKRNVFVKYAMFFSITFFTLLLQSCDTTENPGSTLSVSFNTAQGLAKTNLVSIELDSIKILLRDLRLNMNRTL